MIISLDHFQWVSFTLLARVWDAFPAVSTPLSRKKRSATAGDHKWFMQVQPFLRLIRAYFLLVCLLAPLRFSQYGNSEASEQTGDSHYKSKLVLMSLDLENRPSQVIQTSLLPPNPPVISCKWVTVLFPRRYKDAKEEWENEMSVCVLPTSHLKTLDTMESPVLSDTFVPSRTHIYSDSSGLIRRHANNKPIRSYSSSRYLSVMPFATFAYAASEMSRLAKTKGDGRS